MPFVKRKIIKRHNRYYFKRWMKMMTIVHLELEENYFDLQNNILKD